MQRPVAQSDDGGLAQELLGRRPAVELRRQAGEVLVLEDRRDRGIDVSRVEAVARCERQHPLPLPGVEDMVGSHHLDEPAEVQTDVLEVRP